MTAQTQTLAGFLLARYDEEEALARCEYFPDIDFFRGILEEYSNGPEDYPEARMMAGHIAAHDPAHVLADLAAKRRIVEIHKPTFDESGFYGTVGGWYCYTCDDDRDYNVISVELHCDTLRALAAPYADHADFREEWRA